MTKKQLIAFENKVAKLFKQGKINCPVHLSSGNEDQLIRIFKDIKKKDYVFSTHRSHYHYLLKGGNPKKLLDEILGKPTGICKGQGRSLHIYDRKLNFYTSSVIGSNYAIAVGVAWALKEQGKKNKVWCFGGDGAVDTGHFYEAWRYAIGFDLPITFVFEDNGFAVGTTLRERWGNATWDLEDWMQDKIRYYKYERTRPHVGIK